MTEFEVEKLKMQMEHLERFKKMRLKEEDKERHRKEQEEA